MTNTKEDIKINLECVEKGKPLLKSLVVLNGEFKKAYKKKFGEFEKLDKEEVKAYQKAYHKIDKYKAYQKAYYQRKKLKEIL